MRVSLAVSFDSFYWIEIGSCMTLYQKRESETWYRKSNRPPQLSLQPNFVLRNIKSICKLF